MTDLVGLVVGAVAGGVATIGVQALANWRNVKAARRQVRGQLRNLMTIAGVGLTGSALAENPITAQTISEFSQLVGSTNVTLAYNDEQYTTLLYLEQVARAMSGTIAGYYAGTRGQPDFREECGLLLHRYRQFAKLAGISKDYDEIAYGKEQQIAAVLEKLRDQNTNATAGSGNE